LEAWKRKSWQGEDKVWTGQRRKKGGFDDIRLLKRIEERGQQEHQNEQSKPAAMVERGKLPKRIRPICCGRNVKLLLGSLESLTQGQKHIKIQ